MDTSAERSACAAHLTATRGPPPLAPLYGACVLDCWQTASNTYQGQLLWWTEEAGVNPPTHRLHVQTTSLPTPVVRALFALVDSTQMQTLPSEEAIAAWKPTLDGVSYSFEYTGPLGNGIHSWSNPQLQGSLSEAQTVRRFVDRALTLAQVLAQRPAFEASIPFLCYSNSGGASVACRITSVAPSHRPAKRRQQPH